MRTIWIPGKDTLWPAPLSAVARYTFARNFAVLMAVEVLIALVAGFLFLGDKSFWSDEGATAYFVDLDWESLGALLVDREANQSLYYGLLKVWAIFGDSEFVLRSPSVIFAAAAVPSMVLLGRELFDSRVGLTAGLLLALNPFLLQYAQEARSYALVVLLVTLASYFFVRMVKRPGRSVAVGYVALSVLAVYAHFFALLVISAQILSLVALPRERVPWRVLARSLVGIGVLLSPLGLFMLTTGRGNIWWVPPSGLIDLFDHFKMLAGGWGSLSLYALFLALAAVPAVTALTRRERSEASWSAGLVLSWLIAPTALVFIASYVKPMFISRFLIVSLPPLVLLVALGVSRVRLTWLSHAGLVALVLLSFMGMKSWYLDTGKSDWRGATEYVLANSQAGDVILFHVLWPNEGYRHYVNRAGSPDTAPTVQSYTLADIDSLGEQLANGAHDRVWLVLSGDSDPAFRATSNAIKDSFERSFQRVQERSFAAWAPFKKAPAPPIRVLLYD